AAARRMAAIEKAIGADVMRALKAAKSRDEVVAAFETGVPDGAGRAALYFRMIGTGDGNWNHTFGPDELVVKLLLPGLKGAEVAAAGRAARAAAVLAGGGRWLFYQKGWERLPTDGRDEAVKPVAVAGLTHPRQMNRRRTMAALREMGTPAATELLRKAFAGEYAARKLDPADETEAGGQVEVGPAG